MHRGDRVRSANPRLKQPAVVHACWPLAALLVAAPCAVLAGAQQYQPLAASVQTALHDSIADRASPRLVFPTVAQGNRWLATMSQRLQRQMPDEQTRVDFLTTVQYEATRAGLDPQLVLGVVDVESKFHKYAVSNAGARGYMQVMPFWVDLIGNAEQNLFNLRTNLRYGCVILRHYLDIEGGDLYRALARYNGTPRSDSSYGARVLHAWQTRWAMGNAAKPTSKPTPSRYMGEVR